MDAHPNPESRKNLMKSPRKKVVRETAPDTQHILLLPLFFFLILDYPQWSPWNIMKPPWKAAFVDRPAPGWTRPSQAFKDGIFMWVQGVFAGNIMIIMGYSNLETWEVREMILRMMSQVFGDTLWSRLFMLHLLATFLVSNWCSSFWPPWVLPGSPRSTESIDILFDITGHTFRSEVRIISKTDSKLIFIILSLQHPPPKKNMIFNIFSLQHIQPLFIGSIPM